MSKRQIQRICSLRRQGLSLEQIASAVGCSASTARYILLRQGFPHHVQLAHPKWRQVLSSQKQRILSLRKHGLSLQQIAGDVGCSVSTARNILLQHGFRPRVQLAHPKWGRVIRLHKQRILSLRKRGLTLQQIAGDVGCSITTVRRTLSHRLRHRVPPLRRESLKRRIMSLRKQGYSLARIREVTGVPDVTAMRILQAAGFPGRVPLSHFIQGRIKGICEAKGCGSRRFRPRFCAIHNALHRRGLLNRKGEAVLPKCIDCSQEFPRQRRSERCEACAETRTIQLQRLTSLRYYHRQRRRAMKAANKGKFLKNAKAEARKAGRKRF